MLIGVDQGYTYTKNSKGVIFPSRVRVGETIDINNVIEVQIEGKSYIVGEKESNFTVDTNKVDDEKTKVCILTSIAKSTEREITDVKLITGLPPGQYKQQKEKLKDMLLDSGLTKIIINNQKKYLRIIKADVFVQGAGPIFLNPNQYRNAKVLVIDIGGLTIDCCYFENMKLEKYRTYEKGMLKLYSQMISEVNSKLELNLDVIDGERVLNEGIKIYGKYQNLRFLEPAINSHVEGFMTDIKLDFPIKTVDYIILIGGGSKGLNERLQKYMPNAELFHDSQFTNATCYEQIGRVRFGE
ncbi:ParM/StbA family protein [Crassaminicella thermophila]|uniref:ParM/StbA family protein n=1 Tax=Crassaminicella thermophila TaxID=2599308 RepID=A0A5C0SD89_CRATE|nr:ParM/StbA family protein [Crassaminicella thermophila]QEK11716.1 ParM/StbA family protein [Crassaminicella thermophila]